MSLWFGKTNRRSWVLITVLILSLFLGLLWKSGDNHPATIYKRGDALTLWMDSVGPTNNPHERYPFTTIPYCHQFQNPSWNQIKPPTTLLGEKLVGSELRNSGHDFRFQENKMYQCTTNPLTNQELVTFIKLLQGGDDYLEYSTYRMYLQDIPLYGTIGSEYFTEEEIKLPNFPAYRQSKVIYKVYTTRTLIVQTHQNSIVHARLQSDQSSLVELTEGGAYTFQLEIRFQERGEQDETRDRILEEYADESFYDTRQLSIGMGCFMLTFLALLARRAKADIGKKDEGGGTNTLGKSLLSDNAKSHWHDSNMVGEPENVQLLAAFIGAGTQLLFVTLVVCYQTWIHGATVFQRGEIFDTFWGSMILTSLIGGYALTRTVRVYGEPRMLRLFEQHVELFQRELQLIPDDEISTDNESEMMMMDATKSDNKVLTFDMLRISLYIIAILLPLLHLTILFWLSIFSWIKGTMRAISFTTFVQLYWSWILIALPLYCLGAAISQRERIPRNSSRNSQEPPRPLFRKTWLTQTPVLVMISGLATFIPICIEVLSILGSTLGHDTYKASPSLFVLLAITVLILNVALRSAVTQSLASGNKNQWHWIAFGCGASVAVYVFVAGACYYCLFTSMTGWYQRAYYWLVTIGISADVALVFGALSFWSGHFMVQSLFQQKSV
jgi:transmembrane 9 superfamily protein 3